MVLDCWFKHEFAIKQFCKLLGEVNTFSNNYYVFSEIKKKKITAMKTHTMKQWWDDRSQVNVG